MNCNNFGDPPTFHLAHSSGQNLNLSNTLVYDQIPAKLMTFPSALSVLENCRLIELQLWLLSPMVRPYKPSTQQNCLALNWVAPGLKSEANEESDCREVYEKITLLVT